jgi:hypothetical protein
LTTETECQNTVGNVSNLSPPRNETIFHQCRNDKRSKNVFLFSHPTEGIFNRSSNLGKVSSLGDPCPETPPDLCFPETFFTLYFFQNYHDYMWNSNMFSYEQYHG